MQTRLFIFHGRLIIERASITGPDGHEYEAPPIEYQLYEKGGKPVSSSYEYRGPGAINGKEIVIGDAYSERQLLEAMRREPTTESEDKFRGFVTGIDEKRAPKDVSKKYGSKSGDWWDGYREALAAKRAHREAAPKIKYGRAVK